MEYANLSFKKKLFCLFTFYAPGILFDKIAIFAEGNWIQINVNVSTWFGIYSE